jgi:hypothetical protein
MLSLRDIRPRLNEIYMKFSIIVRGICWGKSQVQFSLLFRPITKPMEKSNNCSSLKKPIQVPVSQVQRSNQLKNTEIVCGAHTRCSCIYTKVMKMGGYRVAFFANAPGYV